MVLIWSDETILPLYAFFSVDFFGFLGGSPLSFLGLLGGIVTLECVVFLRLRSFLP